MQSLLSINLVEKQQPLITPCTSNKSEHFMSVGFFLNKSLIEQRGQILGIASKNATGLSKEVMGVERCISKRIRIGSRILASLHFTMMTMSSKCPAASPPLACFRLTVSVPEATRRSVLVSTMTTA